MRGTTGSTAGQNTSLTPALRAASGFMETSSIPMARESPPFLRINRDLNQLIVQASN